MRRPWVYFCFFVSGFSGLVNEVVWSRLFVYTLGSSHISMAMVVAIFMGGLALGSALGGKIADRSPSPLRLYAWLVLGAGILSAAVVPLLWAAEPLLAAAYRVHDGAPSHPLFNAVKLTICSLAILLPTTFMGATLPALARHLTRNLREVGTRLGALYAVNTFGAVSGAAAAGFYLIARLGLGWTIALGAGLDIAVGVAILIVTRRIAATAAPSAAPAQPAKSHPEKSRPAAPVVAARAPLAREVVPWAVKVAVVAFGISGFVNMCLQIAWTRALIISIGNSTYAFSVIVGIFILGLGVGGWLGGLIADRVKQHVAAFGWALIATAVAAAVTIPALGLSPAKFAWDVAELLKAAASKNEELSYARFLAAGVGSVAWVILPATVLMGMGFPLAGRMRIQGAEGIGRAIGVAYAANTAGAIAGTAMSGFVLMPLLGRIHWLLYLSVALGYLAGVLVLVTAPGAARARRFAVLGALTLGLLTAGFFTRPAGVLEDKSAKPRTPWHPVVFSLGSYRNYNLAQHFKDYHTYAADMLHYWEPLYYRDGEAASVSVLRKLSDGLISLNISGKPESSANVDFSPDLQTQILSGYLALLVHPQPKEVLNLGLGGGITLGTMVSHPQVERVDLLELVPEVVEAAKLYFSEANKGSLTNPKVHTIIGDGRNHLMYTSRTYDVISSQPSNFWIAGLGNLFTEEFYHLVLSRLRPGGVFCQWIYGYNITLSDYQIALRTFLKVFPESSVWTNSYGDTVLLGAAHKMSFDRALLLKWLNEPAMARDLTPIGIAEPEDLFRYYQGPGALYKAWVGEGPVNRDFHPVLEFSSPLGYFAATLDIHAKLADVNPNPIETELLPGFTMAEIERANAMRLAGRTLSRFLYTESLQEYELLVRLGDPWSIQLSVETIATRAKLVAASRGALLQPARKIHDAAEFCAGDAFRLAPGQTALPLEDYRREGERGWARWRHYLALAAVESQAGDPDRALRAIEIARERSAPTANCEIQRGHALLKKKDIAGAQAAFQKALDTALSAAKERAEADHQLGLLKKGSSQPLR